MSSCRRGNNPYMHPSGCDCQRASQAVPYMEDEPVFPASRHAWWDDPDDAHDRMKEKEIFGD